MFTSTPVCWVFQWSCFAFDTSLSVDTHHSASELFSLASLILLAVLLAVYVLLLAVYVFSKFWFVDKLVDERSEFSPKNVRPTLDKTVVVQMGNFVSNIPCMLDKQIVATTVHVFWYFVSRIFLTFDFFFKFEFKKKQPKIESTFSIFWMILLLAESYTLENNECFEAFLIFHLIKVRQGVLTHRNDCFHYENVLFMAWLFILYFSSGKPLYVLNWMSS